MTTLAEISKRWAKCSPSPWKFVAVEKGFPCIEHPHFDIYREVQPVHEIRNEPGIFVGRVDFSEPPRCINVGCWLGEEADAAAIAEAPTDIARLMREVRRLIQENAGLREALDGPNRLNAIPLDELLKMFEEEAPALREMSSTSRPAVLSVSAVKFWLANRLKVPERARSALGSSTGGKTNEK